MQDCIDHGLVGNAGGYGYIRIDGKSEYVYNSRSHGSTALAIKYGVCSTTIRNIVKGVTHAKECVPFRT